MSPGNASFHLLNTSIGKNSGIFCNFLCLLTASWNCPPGNASFHLHNSSITNLCRPNFVHFLWPFKPTNKLSITDPCRAKNVHSITLNLFPVSFREIFAPWQNKINQFRQFFVLPILMNHKQVLCRIETIEC